MKEEQKRELALARYNEPNPICKCGRKKKDPEDKYCFRCEEIRAEVDSWDDYEMTQEIHDGNEYVEED